MRELAGRVSTVEEEIDNLESQISTTGSVVAELEVQMGALREEMDLTTKEMIQTRDELTVRKVELRERLREVYKRGALGPLEVLLAARSFSDLIHRYKYLHLVTLYDRMLVSDVSRLEERLERQRATLSEELSQLSSLRSTKERELRGLRELERQRQTRLARYRGQELRAESRVARLGRRLAQEEERLQVLMAELERTRREEERRTGRASVTSLHTSDMGNLDWPVEGEVLYRYGPERSGSTTIKREGLGIGAPEGAAVEAVESGEVQWAGPRGGYGPSVILSHGGGYYSVYLYLRDLRVRVGDRVGQGQVIGAVGGSASREGPHAEFQIWEPSADGEPRAVDPVRWLRTRS